MIITRSPFRISFVGGGTDFPDYYKNGFGNVISTTIDKYIYVSVNKKFDGKLFLRYSEKELVNDVNELKHDIVREALKMFNIETGIEIVIMSDIPSRGTGLGSSSALSAALILALTRYKNESIDKKNLAKLVTDLELNILKKPIGKQDAYASVYGGLNKIHFSGDNVLVSRINGEFYSGMSKWIESISMLFYFGNGRNADNILKTHIQNIEFEKENLDKQRGLVISMLAWLLKKQYDFKIGELVNEGFELKKKITPKASNKEIDKLIEKAKQAGACGVKVAGAGAGGFMLVLSRLENQNKIRKALNLHELNFKFENEGTKIIYE